MCIYSLGRQLVEKGFVIYFLKVLLACLAAAVQPNSTWNSPNEFSTSCHPRVYKATHLLANLGWVDFDFGFPTLCLVLPGLMRNWQNWLSSWARWWNIPNQSQPNRGSPGDVSPCNEVPHRVTDGTTWRWYRATLQVGDYLLLT